VELAGINIEFQRFLLFYIFGDLARQQRSYSLRAFLLSGPFHFSEIGLVHPLDFTFKREDDG
jgi:hypothetical protein